jgi:hypothetical protein
MTQAGIVATARALTGADMRSDAKPDARVRAVSVDDVERMKRLIALVPFPSLELAEQLRQRFLPTVPEDVLLFLAAETAGRAAATIRFDEGEIRRLVSAERRDDPVQELAVRRFLRAMLVASRPAAGSVAYARWQLDVAVQDLHLAALAPEDHAAPAETVNALANGPLAEEVADALRIAAAAGSRTVAGLQRRAAAATVTAGLRDRPGWRWTWPGLAEPAAALAAALLVFATLNEWGPFPSRAIAHETDAYRLEFDASAAYDEIGSLRAERLPGRPATPASAELYRGDARVGTLSFSSDGTAVATVASDQGGAWYWLRAQLPSGNLATSNLVLVPPAPGGETKRSDPIDTVTVVVNLLPWARVLITSPDGSGTAPSGTFVTPFTVALRPGNYLFQGENGGATATLQLPVTVAPSSQPQLVNRAMPGFNPDRIVDSLLGPTSK